MGSVMGIISGKGGVGKTTITVNLGVTLVKYFSKKVLVMDGNITAPNLGLYLGFLETEKSIIDVLRNRIDIKDCIYLHPSGLHVIPSSLESFDEEMLKRIDLLEEKINEIKDFYDYILIDSAAGISLEVLEVIKISDYIILVCLPEISSIISMLKARRVVLEYGKRILGLIINRVAERTKMERSYTEYLSYLRIIGEIPFSKLVAKSIAEVKPAVLLEGDKKFVEAFKEIAANVIGTYYIKKVSFWEKLKEILWRR
ncbi:MAG: AAA family ATPase [Candidatus Aenigmatarchaeota archaeon]